MRGPAPKHTAVVFLVVMKKVKPAFPRALAVVLFGTVLVYGLGLHDGGVAIVGEVPSGLPTPQVPVLDADVMRRRSPLRFSIVR